MYFGIDQFQISTPKYMPCILVFNSGIKWSDRNKCSVHEEKVLHSMFVWSVPLQCVFQFFVVSYDRAVVSCRTNLDSSDWMDGQDELSFTAAYSQMLVYTWFNVFAGSMGRSSKRAWMTPWRTYGSRGPGPMGAAFSRAVFMCWLYATTMQ